MKKLTPQRIRQITESIIGLPTLPTVIAKMIELVDSPKTSSKSLARLISSDQSLTAKLLKLANSAYYGFPREISTINMAIVVLGFNTVKDIGLSLTVFDVFRNSGETSKNFDATRFWEHSIACGMASRLVAESYEARFSSEAFVAGLLHDIGKVILNQYFHEEFSHIMALLVDEKVSLDDAELQTIGVSHAEIGAWLAEKWNLPKIIVNAIRYHHEPWNAPTDSSFVGAITIADYLCHTCGIGHSGRNKVPELSEFLLDALRKCSWNLDETDISNLQTSLLLNFDKADFYMSIIRD